MVVVLMVVLERRERSPGSIYTGGQPFTRRSHVPTHDGSDPIDATRITQFLARAGTWKPVEARAPRHVEISIRQNQKLRDVKVGRWPKSWHGVHSGEPGVWIVKRDQWR